MTLRSPLELRSDSVARAAPSNGLLTEGRGAPAVARHHGESHKELDEKAWGNAILSHRTSLAGGHLRDHRSRSEPWNAAVEGCTVSELPEAVVAPGVNNTA